MTKAEAFEYINTPRVDPLDMTDSNYEFLKELVEGIFTGRTVKFVSTPTITINTETGDVLSMQDQNIMTLESSPKIDTRFLEMRTSRISKISDVASAKKYVYVYKMEIQDYVTTVTEGSGLAEEKRNRFLELRWTSFNVGKKNVTFSIAEDVYERFITTADSLSMNRSKFVENKMKEFLEKIG